MTNTIIKTTKLILLTLLVNIHSSDTEEGNGYIVGLDDLKNEFTNKSIYKKILFGSIDIKPTDLNEIKLERPLDKLTLKFDAVYLLRYISADETKDTHIKKLTLESYNVNTALENIVKEQNAQKSGLKSVDEITGEGIVAITEILTGMSFDSNKPVKVLSLFTCLTIDLESILRIRNNDTKNGTLFYKELKITGKFSPKILKSIYEKYGENTEILRINYSPRVAMKFNGILEENDSIRQLTKLKTLILEDGAVLFFVCMAGKDVQLFHGDIENIILKSEYSLEEFFKLDDGPDLLVCDNLELHSKAIIVLPFICDVSLKRIDKIKTKYRKTDVSLKGIRSNIEKCGICAACKTRRELATCEESQELAACEKLAAYEELAACEELAAYEELAACETVLKDNASDELKELDLSAKKSGLLDQKTEKRLKILFGMTLHADV